METWSPRKGCKAITITRDDITIIDDCSDSGAFSPLPRPPPPQLGWRSTAMGALECFTRKKNTGGCSLFPKQFKILVAFHTNMLLTKNECQRRNTFSFLVYEIEMFYDFVLTLPVPGFWPNAEYQGGGSN